MLYANQVSWDSLRCARQKSWRVFDKIREFRREILNIATNSKLHIANKNSPLQLLNQKMESLQNFPNSFDVCWFGKTFLFSQLFFPTQFCHAPKKRRHETRFWKDWSFNSILKKFKLFIYRTFIASTVEVIYGSWNAFIFCKPRNS